MNVKGYFYTARACHPHMKRRGGGKIINVASIAGVRPQPGMGVYCVTKAAVLMLTEVLAAELASDNIQVNAIVPGFIRTRFSRVLWETPALHDAIVQQIPQRRMAEPEELVGLALFLASSASDYMTGAALPIDGGLLIGYPPCPCHEHASTTRSAACRGAVVPRKPRLSAGTTAAAGRIARAHRRTGASGPR